LQAYAPSAGNSNEEQDTVYNNLELDESHYESKEIVIVMEDI